MNDRECLFAQKYMILKRLRANNYATANDRKRDLLSLRAVMSWMELRKKSRNHEEIKQLLNELPPDEPNPRYEPQARGWMCELEKKETEKPAPKIKAKTLTMVMDSSGGLVWRKR